jgi:hypothetical protein
MKKPRAPERTGLPNGICPNCKNNLPQFYKIVKRKADFALDFPPGFAPNFTKAKGPIQWTGPLRLGSCSTP